MKNADMVILIIGGNYGSPATGEDYESGDFLSITKKEIYTASNNGIPIYTFIDSAVYTEHGVYMVNMNEIEDSKININFNATKSINVFRFINYIKSLTKLPITEFKKVSDIKDFLSKQWSDMFKKYIDILKENQKIEDLQQTVIGMQTLVQKMDIMIEGIGKQVLSQNIKEYEIIVDKQKDFDLLNICEIISSGIQCYKTNYNQQENIEILIENIKYTLYNLQTSIDSDYQLLWSEMKEKKITCTYKHNMLKDLIKYYRYFIDDIDTLKTLMLRKEYYNCVFID